MYQRDAAVNAAPGRVLTQIYSYTLIVNNLPFILRKRMTKRKGNLMKYEFVKVCFAYGKIK